MEDLRIAVLDFLAFERSFIKEAFLTFEKFTENTSDETIAAQLEIITEKSSEEDKLLDTVRKEQEKLARLYEFTIETEEGK